MICIDLYLFCSVGMGGFPQVGTGCTLKGVWFKNVVYLLEVSNLHKKYFFWPDEGEFFGQIHTFLFEFDG